MGRKPPDPELRSDRVKNRMPKAVNTPISWATVRVRRGPRIRNSPMATATPIAATAREMKQISSGIANSCQ